MQPRRPLDTFTKRSSENDEEYVANFMRRLPRPPSPYRAYGTYIAEAATSPPKDTQIPVDNGRRESHPPESTQPLSSSGPPASTFASSAPVPSIEENDVPVPRATANNSPIQADVVANGPGILAHKDLADRDHFNDASVSKVTSVTLSHSAAPSLLSLIEQRPPPRDDASSSVKTTTNPPPVDAPSSLQQMPAPPTTPQAQPICSQDSSSSSLLPTTSQPPSHSATLPPRRRTARKRDDHKRSERDRRETMNQQFQLLATSLASAGMNVDVTVPTSGRPSRENPHHNKSGIIQAAINYIQNVEDELTTLRQQNKELQSALELSRSNAGGPP